MPCILALECTSLDSLAFCLGDQHLSSACQWVFRKMKLEVDLTLWSP